MNEGAHPAVQRVPDHVLRAAADLLRQISHRSRTLQIYHNYEKGKSGVGISIEAGRADDLETLQEFLNRAPDSIGGFPLVVRLSVVLPLNGGRERLRQIAQISEQHSGAAATRNDEADPAAP